MLRILTFTTTWLIDNGPLILVLYVDYLFLIGAYQLIVGCKRELAYEFEMKDLGLMHYFLGLEVWKILDDIFLSQGKYTVEILRRFDMLDCKSMVTLIVTNLKKPGDSSLDSYFVDPTMYRKLIEPLMYLVNTRPYICFVVSTLIQFMVELSQLHWVLVKHALRYLHGIFVYGLKYVSSGEVRLHDYTDPDRGGVVPTKTSP